MRTGPALSYILMVFWLAFYSKTATMYCKSSPVSAFDFNWASASWQSEQRHQFSRQLSIQCLSHLILPRLLDSHFVGLVLHQKLVDLHVLSEIQHDVSAWCPRKLSNVVIARNHAEPHWSHVLLRQFVFHVLQNLPRVEASNVWLSIPVKRN